MFGFGKKDREERQSAEAIRQGLDMFGTEFLSALRETANAYGIRAYPAGDELLQDKYLAILVASAFSMGSFFNAEQKTVRKALKDYFTAFTAHPQRDVEYAIATTSNDEIISRHQELVERTFQVWHLMRNQRDDGVRVDRNELMMSLAQIYLRQAIRHQSVEF